MLIKVTQSHIDRGCRGDGTACPIALAVLEATGYDVMVGEDWITALDHNLMWWRTPVITKIKINLFDAGEEILPFEFELDVEGVG